VTKRIVKSPKLLFVGTGLLCYLLRIENAEQLIHSPFSEHIFENMVIMEVVKRFAEKGERAPCYFYRTYSGVEIDLLVDFGSYQKAYEIKFSSTPTLPMTKPLAQSDFSNPTLLTMYSKRLPFPNGVIGEHWSTI